MPHRLLINVFNVDAALAIGRAKGLFAAADLDVDAVGKRFDDLLR
ncbi:MAG TPA: hypothetical protein VGW77_32975 [Candidatus Binatia bacterium]|jgi:hypothetical protein|nr:hypothetical protein [Candidatus Binatia bacterium]